MMRRVEAVEQPRAEGMVPCGAALAMTARAANKPCCESVRPMPDVQPLRRSRTSKEINRRGFVMAELQSDGLGLPWHTSWIALEGYGACHVERCADRKLVNC